MNLHRNLQIAKAAIALTAGAVLAGCDGTNVTEQLHTHNPVNATVYVASATGVSRNDQTGATAEALATGLDGGVAIDQARNLVQVGANLDAIRTFCSAADIAATPVAGTFREITGATNAANIDIAHEAGAYIVTNGTSTVSIYASNAEGAAGTLDTFTTTSGAAAAVAYDDVADRLFVATTSGTIEIYDDFVADGFGDSAPRIVDTGTDAFTDETVADFRSIAYDAQQDRLVVGDIGAPEGSDGRILIFEGASSVTGGGTDPGTAADPGDDPFLVPDVVIAGASTGLSDPVGLSLKGVSLRIADSGADEVMFYTNIFVAAFGATPAADGSFDVAPAESYASTDPVAIVADPVKVFPPVNHTNSGVSNIAYVDNVPAGATQVQHLGLTVNANGETIFAGAGNAFDSGEPSVENLTFDANGDGYATFDDNSDVLGSGGVMIVHRLAKGRDGDTLAANRDRVITGATAGLASPKGIIMLGGTGYFAVAESSANGVDGAGVYVYSACQSGNTAPVGTLATSGTPWDMDYDWVSDILFVAQTNGTVDVYADFLATLLAGDPIALTVTIDVDAATNLHGIHYDVGSDTLILSDVGVVGTNNDGVLWVVQDVSGIIDFAVDGAVTTVAVPTDYPDTTFRVNHEGATVLGNPVDITYDGANLYVANKTSSGAPGVLVFSNFFATLDEDVIQVLPDDSIDPPDGDSDPDLFCPEDTCEDFIVDAEATDEEPATAPESVSLVPDFLSTAP